MIQKKNHIFVCNENDRFGRICAFAVVLAGFRFKNPRKGSVSGLKPSNCELTFERKEGEKQEQYIEEGTTVHFCGCDPDRSKWEKCTVVIHEAPTVFMTYLCHTFGTRFSDRFTFRAELVTLSQIFSREQLRGLAKKKKS